jgi:hypothetical protein
MSGIGRERHYNTVPLLSLWRPTVLDGLNHSGTEPHCDHEVAWASFVQPLLDRLAWNIGPSDGRWDRIYSSGVVNGCACT